MEEREKGGREGKGTEALDRVLGKGEVEEENELVIKISPPTCSSTVD